jgi:hypothetical protein
LVSPDDAGRQASAESRSIKAILESGGNEEENG